MRRVIVESPYAAGDPPRDNLERNIKYARAAVRDCLMRGESPLAFHLLHTQEGILRDEVPEERTKGISAGLEWTELADAVVVYQNLGISHGMNQGIMRAILHNKIVEYRTLPGWGDGQEER